jgi:hypothetical protein
MIDHSVRFVSYITMLMCEYIASDNERALDFLQDIDYIVGVNINHMTPHDTIMSLCLIILLVKEAA